MDDVTVVITALVIVAIIAVFYFVLIRPSNKRKHEKEQMQLDVKVGDVVTTIGGIVGTVCALKDKTMVLEIGADRVRIEFDLWALSEITISIDKEVQANADKKKLSRTQHAS